MTRIKYFGQQNPSMKKAGILALAVVLTLSLASGQIDQEVKFNNVDPEDESIYQITEEGGTIEVSGDVFSNKDGVLKTYFWYDRENFSYYPSNDSWVVQDDGTDIDYDLVLDKVRNVTAGQFENFQFEFDSDKGGGVAYPVQEGNYTMHLVVDRGGTDIKFKEVHFTVEKVEGIQGVEDEDEIIDGGMIDDAIQKTADYLGAGINLTRMAMSFFLSLAVGLAIGWKEQYSSSGLAYIGFLLTFATTILIGLAPVIEGVIFLSLLIAGSWVVYSND
jgi:hypothetical protein